MVSEPRTDGGFSAQAVPGAPVTASEYRRAFARPYSLRPVSVRNGRIKVVPRKPETRTPVLEFVDQGGSFFIVPRRCGVHARSVIK